MKMKTKLTFSAILFALLLVFSNNVNAQFNNAVLQIGVGIVEPMGDLKGTYYQENLFRNYNLFSVNKDFMTNNFGAKTGFGLFGKGKINFDKFNIIRGTASIGFNTFNTFEPTKNGMIGVIILNNTGQYDTIPSSATFNYTFNTFQFGLGIEVAPTAFTNVLSPYFGANITFNSFSGKLSRTENRLDSTNFSFSEFRIGASLDAGIEAKFSKIFGLSLGVKFDLGNILLKKTTGDIASRQSWGQTGSFLNDDDGTFFSNLYTTTDPASPYRQYTSKKKNLNWGMIYVAANIYINAIKSKTPKKK